MRFIVDTNVCIAANGINTNASIECRLATIDFLEKLMSSGVLIVDENGHVEEEYRKHLSAGNPGVGNRFIQKFLNSASGRIERFKLEVDRGGDYVQFPKVKSLQKFDRSDRKFATLSIASKAPVVNACDTDWLEFKVELEKCGIKILFLCGENPARWFVGGGI